MAASRRKAGEMKRLNCDLKEREKRISAEENAKINYAWYLCDKIAGF